MFLKVTWQTRDLYNALLLLPNDWNGNLEQTFLKIPFDPSELYIAFCFRSVSRMIRTVEQTLNELIAKPTSRRANTPFLGHVTD